ncbi:ABC transporter substrate-binding protein [Clostridium sp. AN503]|uniref:ABC transporter substrate-binding protein n=1 Tax=Clostridium sp. AN503 TaxID=3160598 RepID=UPI003458D4A6
MRRNMKKAVALTMAAVTAMSLTACGGSSASSEKAPAAGENQAGGAAQADGGSDEQINLTFSWWGGDSRHEATEKAIAAFMEKYPNINVTPEYGAWTGWEEKQSLNILGGNSADVMQINWNWIESYSGNGTNFANLEDYSDVLDLTQFPESSLELCKADGKLMAVPVALTGRLFYWNKTTFDEVGCPIPTDTESLMAAGAAFKAFNEDYYPLALGEYDRIIFMVYYLESIYNKPWVENGELNYTVEEIQKGMDFMCELEAAHAIPTIATIQGDMADSLDKNAKWIDGKYAGIFEWDSAASKCQKAVVESTNKPGQEFVIGDFIKFGDHKGGFTKISMGLAVSASSAHPKEAAMLINFLLNDPEGVEISSTERGIPCSRAAVEILNEKGLGDALVKEANAKVLDYCPFPLDSKFEHNDLKANPDGVYYKVFGKLSSGDIDSAKAAQDLIDGINECMGN